MNDEDFVVTPPIEFHNVPSSLQGIMRDLQHAAPWFPPDMFVSVRMDPDFHTRSDLGDAAGVTDFDIPRTGTLEALITLPVLGGGESNENKGRALYAFFHEYVSHAMVGAQTDAKLEDPLSVMVEHKRLYHPSVAGENPWHYMVKQNLHRIPAASRPEFLRMYAGDMGTLALLDLRAKESSPFFNRTIDFPMAEAGLAWTRELRSQSRDPDSAFWQVTDAERVRFGNGNPMRLTDQDYADKDFYG